MHSSLVGGLDKMGRKTIARCRCGWKSKPYWSAEKASKVLMAHYQEEKEREK